MSAPVFAGLVTQLYAAVRATPGLEGARLGHLNPFLYCECALGKRRDLAFCLKCMCLFLKSR